MNDPHGLPEGAARAQDRAVVRQAALVREAIDLRFESGQAKRVEAGRRVIAEFSNEPVTEPDWSESKKAIERDLDNKLP